MINASVVAVDGQGRTLVADTYGGVHAPSAVLERLLPNGSLDTTFGTNGVVTIGTGPDTTDYPNEGGVSVSQVIPLADGDILLNGTTVQELTAAGKPDTRFGGGGPDDVGKGSGTLYLDDTGVLAAQPDGKLLLDEEIYGATTGSVERFNADGSVDASYGTKGTATISSSTAASVEGGVIVVDSAGRAVVSVAVKPSAASSGTAYGVARLTTAGRLDSSFGTGGFDLAPTLADGGATYYAALLALAPNGTIVQAAADTTDTDQQYLFAYSADGKQVGGGSTASLSGYSGIRALSVGTDGKPVIATTSSLQPADVIVQRFLPIAAVAGSTVAFDPTFAAGGSTAVAYPDVPDPYSQGAAATFEPDSIAVAKGSVVIGSSSQVGDAVTRVLTAGASSVTAEPDYGVKVIGSAGSYANHGNTITNAFDQKLNTFYDAYHADGDWAGLDLGSPTSLVQVKFAPRAGYAARMVGGQFQVSSTADFSSDVHTIYTVTAVPASSGLTTVAVGDVGAYRYFRYIGPANGECNVAEVQALVAGYTQVAGTAIGTAGSYRDQGNTIANAFDGSTATFVDAATGSGAYVGEDFGSAVSVFQVKLAPRAGYTGRMVGGLIQASDSATFADPIDVYTFDAAPPAGQLTAYSLYPEVGAHRYWRYVGPDGGSDNLAELEFDNFG